MLTRHDAASATRSRAGRRLAARVGRFLGLLGLALLALAALAGALTYLVVPPWDVPEQTARVGAGVLTVLGCGLAAHRVGVRTMTATVFAAVAVATALYAQWPWLVAGVAALAATATAVLAVTATRPAQSPARLLREYVVAVGCSLAGAVAVLAYEPSVRPNLFGNVVLLFSLLAMLWLAHRIGGGFAGLGRRGGIVVVSAALGLVFALAYGEALRQWGSPGLVGPISSLLQSASDVFGAVPRGTEALLGFPALVWGLATRAQLRQGWWVCAFGSVGTAGVATSLVRASDEIGAAMLATGYSVVVGLVLGFLLWRMDQLLTGPRGRRARRLERAQPLRPEPLRTRPLR